MSDIFVKYSLKKVHSILIKMSKILGHPCGCFTSVNWCQIQDQDWHTWDQGILFKGLEILYMSSGMDTLDWECYTQDQK